MALRKYFTVNSEAGCLCLASKAFSILGLMMYQSRFGAVLWSRLYNLLIFLCFMDASVMYTSLMHALVESVTARATVTALSPLLLLIPGGAVCSVGLGCFYIWRKVYFHPPVGDMELHERKRPRLWMKFSDRSVILTSQLFFKR